MVFLPTDGRAEEKLYQGAVVKPKSSLKWIMALFVRHLQSHATPAFYRGDDACDDATG